MFNLLHVVKLNLPVKDGSAEETKQSTGIHHWPLTSISGAPVLLQTWSGTYLVCLLPFSSCWATEAHLSASCVTSRRCLRRSLSGNFFISDSSIKALKLMRPVGKDISWKSPSVMDFTWCLETQQIKCISTSTSDTLCVKVIYSLVTQRKLSIISGTVTAKIFT